MDSINETRLLEAIRKYIEYTSHGTNYNLERFASEGIAPDSVQNCIRILMAGFKDSPFHVRWIDGYCFEYSNSFDASYGWENVLSNAFAVMVPHCEPGLRMTIEADIECYTLISDGRNICTIH